LFLEALLAQDPDLEVLVMKTLNTLQCKALSWLGFEDPLNLDSEMAPGRDILKCFVLATFYFAIDGFKWKNEFKFLKESGVHDGHNGKSLESGLFGDIRYTVFVVKFHISAWVSKLVLLFHATDKQPMHILTLATKSLNRWQ
jgi:hypothetical protein